MKSRQKNSLSPLYPLALAPLLVAFLLTADARAQYLPVYGSPTYDPITQTGLKDGHIPSCWCVNDSGTAVGYAEKFVGGGSQGRRAVRWDAGGAPATELDPLGTNSGGTAWAYANAVNDAGTAVGYDTKYVGGIPKGDRAVRWDPGSTAATELGNLGTDPSGFAGATASAVNAAGTAVGSATKIVGGSGKGYRAVRWDAGGTAATELGSLGTDGFGETFAHAGAINDGGTAVGSARKYAGGSYYGWRAVRWDAGGTAATELGNLGTNIFGGTDTKALAVSAAGPAVGWADKWVGGSDQGSRAVRWDAGGTAANELGNLGTDASGAADASALAVNAAGTAVGWADKWVGGIEQGSRAVRWDAGGTAATELGNLGTHASGAAEARAVGVSAAGMAVGWADKWVGGMNQGCRAVLWGLDGVAVNLNSMIDPTSGWTLTNARAISDNELWIAGEGLYDPDGAGPQQGYGRLWVMQVPEPAGLAMLGLGALALLRRRRRP